MSIDENYYTEMVRGLETQMRETEEEFIYAMISPFCERIVEKKLSKKELESILRKDMQKEWIPVSERLPEDETPVLITISYHGGSPVVRNGIYNKGYFFIDSGNVWEAADTGVTAWMPMPEPYKEESEAKE